MELDPTYVWGNFFFEKFLKKKLFLGGSQFFGHFINGKTRFFASLLDPKASSLSNFRLSSFGSDQPCFRKSGYAIAH